MFYIKLDVLNLKNYACIVLRLCLSYFCLEGKKTVIISYNVNIPFLKKKNKSEADCQCELTALLMLLAYAIQEAKNSLGGSLILYPQHALMSPRSSLSLPRKCWGYECTLPHLLYEVSES